MLVHRQLISLLIVAFSATNTVAAAAAAASATSGHLRGLSVVELEASPVEERQLKPDCENGGNNNGNGIGPCKQDASTETTTTTTSTTTSSAGIMRCPAPEDAVALLSGQACTPGVDPDCSFGTATCCSVTTEVFCTCNDLFNEYECPSPTCASPCP